MSTPQTVLTFVFALALSELAIAQDTTLVSLDSAGAQGNDHSTNLYTLNSVSADGNVVAFCSFATNLVPGDTNGWMDVFVHDRTTGLTERVSVDSAGVEGNAASYTATLSADGNVVVFSSGATNLVAGDTNGFWDIFVHDRSTGITERVSVDSAGGEANNYSGGGVNPMSISSDGRWVAFTSNASNLVSGDTNGTGDVFVHDRSTGITERVNVDSTGAQAKWGGHCGAISADGNAVAFYSSSPDLVAGDTNGTPDAFVHDRSTGITERLSVDSSGAQGNGYSDASMISISPDGQVVVFVSYSTNLVPGDTNGWGDIFLRDRSKGTTERVSVDSSGIEGNMNTWGPTMSADTRFVAFVSAATNLVAGDTNGVQDVFVHDRTTGTTERVSVDASGGQAIYIGADASISADGEVVVFTSDKLVAGDNNNKSDIFARDRCDAYWSNYGAGFPGTNGVPSLTAQADPVLGTKVTVDLANSSGGSTAGVLFIGIQRTQIPTSRGGDLLVDPLITLLLSIPANGTSIADDLPDDDAFCGLAIDLQAIEIDTGATKGLSFTAGLELVLGR